MRKVTEITARAFAAGEEVKVSNTKVMGNAQNIIMTLHDNVITTKEGKKLLITHSGWKTNTTKERLNGVLDACGIDGYIAQRKGEWFYFDRKDHKAQEFTGVKEFKI